MCWAEGSFSFLSTTELFLCTYLYNIEVLTRLTGDSLTRFFALFLLPLFHCIWLPYNQAITALHRYRYGFESQYCGDSAHFVWSRCRNLKAVPVLQNNSPGIGIWDLLKPGLKGTRREFTSEENTGIQKSRETFTLSGLFELL